MSASESSNSDCICVLAIPVLIGIVFTAMKLSGYVSWSWWWVTAPFWEVAAIGGVVLTYVLGAMPAKQIHRGRQHV